MVAAYSTLRVEILEPRLALSATTSTSQSDDSVVEDLGTTSAEEISTATLPPAPTVAMEGMSSVPHKMPTLRAVQSGAWSSTSTWEGGVLPSANSVVEIPQGIQVQIGATNAVADELIIHGRVDFATSQNTALYVTSIYVLPEGTLTIGTEAAPIAASVTATIVFADRPIDTALDPTQLGHGLVVHGTLRIHGAALNETFVRLATEPKASDTQLQLEVPLNWRAGDRIVVPDSRQSLGWETDVANLHGDTAQISAVTNGGRTIVLAAPLQWDHPGARDADSVLVFLPHVANLSRNVVLRSENLGGVRGHTMYTERADVDVRYARYYGLGRTKIDTLDNTTFDQSGNVTHIGTNQIGRYPIHLHHLMGPENPSAAYQYVFQGNSIDGGDAYHHFKSAMAIHQSHYGLVSKNVAWNWSGSGIWTEDGSESNNVIEKNFVGWVHGTGGRPDSGQTSNDGKGNIAFEGTAYWFHGPNNFVRNNVAAMNFGTAAFMYYHANTPRDLKIPSQPGGIPELSYVPYFNPVLESTGNEAYAATTKGLEYWNVGINGFSLEGSPADLDRSYFDGFSIWHATTGVYGYESRNVTLKDITIMGNPLESLNYPTFGMDFGDYIQKDLIISGAHIQGMRIGIISPKIADVRYETGATVGITHLESSYLRNYRNVEIGTMYHNNSAGGLAPKRLIIDNVEFAQVPAWHDGLYDAPQQNIAMAFLGGGERLSNSIQRDEVTVLNYDGQAGNNFRVYYYEQHPEFFVPQSRGDGEGIGSPEAGLTNQENWNKYGIAVAGSIAPQFQTLPRIHGFVSALDGSSLAVQPQPAVIFGVESKLFRQQNGSFGWDLRWITNRATSYRITRYGQATPLAAGTQATTVHQIQLHDFAAGDRLHFFIEATDAFGTSISNQHIIDFPAPSSPPPEINNVLFTPQDVDGRAIINWRTYGVPSTSRIEYGLTTAYGSVVSSSWLEQFHALTLEDLDPGKTYHFRIRSVDAWGNEAVSGDFTFTTRTGVHLDDGVVWLLGTDSDDHIIVTLGTSHVIELNGASHSFASASVTGISIDGGGGTDQLNLTGTAASETAELRFGQFSYTGPELIVSGQSLESIFLTSGGGTDQATFYDSPVNDLYQASSQYAVMFNSAFYNRVDGFMHTYAHATGGGYDEVRMYDSAANDLYQMWSDKVVMFSPGSSYYNWAGGFEYARGFATAGGYDEARMYDTPGNDFYQAWSHLVTLQGANFYNTAAGFELTRGMATSGGWDEARFYDTPGNDKFVAQRNLSTMSGAGYFGRAEGFDVVQAIATAGGTDEATFHDTAGNDLYRTYAGDANMSAPGQYYHRAQGFDVTIGYSTAGGTDEVNMYDSSGNDLLTMWSDKASMSGPGFVNWAGGFEVTRGYATSGGYDEVRMYDSSANDLYQMWSDKVVMFSPGSSSYYNWAGGFEYTRGFATAGGYDEARMYDTPGNDFYQAWSHLVTLQGTNFYNTAAGFELTRGMATSGGWDEARFYDTAGNDKFVAQRNLSTMSGAGYFGRAEGFDVVQAIATAGGTDEATFHDTAGNDLYRTYAGDANMSAPGQYYHRAQGFDVTIGYSTAGGTDEVQMYDSPGNDLYTTYPTTVTMSGSGFVNWAGGFEVTRGYATSGGYDEVRMYDSAGDDLFRAWQGRATMSGTGYANEAEGFESQRGFATAGGFDEARIEDSPGNDHLTAHDWGVLLEGPALRIQAIGFERVEAHGIHGGVNTSDLAAIDYALELIGQWT